MEIIQRIEEVLNEQVRPYLHEHGGEVKLIDCQNGVVYIDLLGACSGCPSADLGTKGFIESVLTENIEGIREVEIERETNPELLAFARKLLFHEDSLYETGC